MALCPTCQSSLNTQRQREDPFYLCPTCHGRMGHSNVAATAHLGGALAGFLAWILWRRFAWTPPEEPAPAE